MYRARVLKDSFAHNSRLTSLEIVFPRFILAELNTHRVFSRNSASSRAIPPEKIIAAVKANPFIPEWNRRVKGMGVGDPLAAEKAVWAKDAWLSAMNNAVKAAEQLIDLDVDKSRVNRLLEPFMWHTCIVTATDWSNFFALRTAPDAQPEMRKIAVMMKAIMASSKPQAIGQGAWHLPLVSDEEIGEKYPTYDPLDSENWVRHWDYWKKVSVGRCARVSYLTHDGVRDPDADITLHDRLLTSGHMSPLEHVARPIWDYRKTGNQDHCLESNRCGNFSGWHQYRAEIPHQHDFALVQSATCAITS